MELREYINLQVALLREVGLELSGIDIVDPNTGRQLKTFLWIAFTESGMAQEISTLYEDLNFWGAGLRYDHNPREQDPIKCASELLENYRESNPDAHFPVLEEILKSFAHQEV